MPESRAGDHFTYSQPESEEQNRANEDGVTNYIEPHIQSEGKACYINILDSIGLDF